MLKAVAAGVFGMMVIAALAAVLSIIWADRRKDRRSKILTTIPCVLWGLFFVAIEAILATFAAGGSILASKFLYLLTVATVCFGGISTLMAHACRFKHAGSVASGGSLSRSRITLWKCFSKVVGWVLPLLAIAGVALLCFVFLEAPSNSSFLSIDSFCMSWEMLIIVGVVAGCWLVFQRRPAGFILPMVASLVYGIAEYFVESFKNSMITPSDLRSIGTAAQVAGGYEYEFTATTLILIALFAFIAGMVSWLKDPLVGTVERRGDVPAGEHWEGRAAGGVAVLARDEDEKREWDGSGIVKQFAVAAVSLIAGISLIVTPVSVAVGRDWKEILSEFNIFEMDVSADSYGLIPSFIYFVQLEGLEAPIGYEHADAEELQGALADLYDEYIGTTSERRAAVAQFCEAKPNVVLIMNESFSDLSVFDQLNIGYEGPRYVNAMDAIAKGSASVSIHGGGTCNSEFEALTGVSLGYIGGVFYPYTFCNFSRVDTLPKQFKTLGYDTVAIHPAEASNFYRDKVYPTMGFDEFVDIGNFEDAALLRDYVRDAETYDMVIDRLTESDTPQFVFDLTMMGHGGYSTGQIPEEEDAGYDFANVFEGDLGHETDEYLSAIKAADQEIQQFLAKLYDIDEPTVVVFFGDHQPSITKDIMGELRDGAQTVADFERLFQTDYFIWANYGISGSDWSEAMASAEDGVALYSGTMSPANLMGWTMSCIGAPLTEYEKASYISRAWIESNNINGFMDTAGVWHSMGDANAVADSDIYDEGMGIIDQCTVFGLPTVAISLMEDDPVFDGDSDAVTSVDAVSESVQYADAVMVNVMKWITYMNFVELI